MVAAVTLLEYLEAMEAVLATIMTSKWWLPVRAKQQQEQISPNHVQAIFSGSVHGCYLGSQQAK